MCREVTKIVQSSRIPFTKVSPTRILQNHGKLSKVRNGHLYNLLSTSLIWISLNFSKNVFFSVSVPNQDTTLHPVL